MDSPKCVKNHSNVVEHEFEADRMESKKCHTKESHDFATLAGGITQNPLPACTSTTEYSYIENFSYP